MRCGLYINNKEMLLRDENVNRSDTESQGKLCNSPEFNPRILRYVVSEERQMKQCCTLALEKCKLYSYEKSRIVFCQFFVNSLL